MVRYVCIYIIQGRGIYRYPFSSRHPFSSRLPSPLPSKYHAWCHNLYFETKISFLCLYAEFFHSSSFSETATAPEVQTSRFLTIHPLDDDETNDFPLKRKKWTRKVWGKSTVLDATESPITDGESPSVISQPLSATVRYSQLAKYSTHHLPDPQSRCASRMVRTHMHAVRNSSSRQLQLDFVESQETSDGPTLCKSQCRVLSVSGTPVHPGLEASDGNKTVYEPMLRCLAMENRKAGGYFLQYLGKLENTAYMNCLRFWREVQEYKTLYIQESFSPCTVEMKAKVYIYTWMCTTLHHHKG